MSNTNDNKKKLLERLEESHGVVSVACHNANLSRQTFYRYKKNDPEFAEKVKDIDEIAIDFVESKLFECIANLKETSIIFYLKTKGKSRGYSQDESGQKVDISKFKEEMRKNGVEAR